MSDEELTRLRDKYNLRFGFGSCLRPDQEELLAILDKLSLDDCRDYLNSDKHGRVAGILRGHWAEQLFITAWSGDYTKQGIKSVILATQYEDMCEETDAWIILINGFRLRVQVKSHQISAGEFIKYATKGILILQVCLSDTPEHIRQNTIEACLRYNEIVISV